MVQFRMDEEIEESGQREFEKSSEEMID